MSLPQAQKEISAHPGKMAVTSPTDKAVMEADVDRKMRLYGVIQAFRQNRYPDNVQIDETLSYVLENSPVDESKLSREGRKLIQDVRDIIETARVMIRKKNSDELFQNFLFHTTNNEAQMPSADTGVVDVSKDDTKRDADQAVEHLRTLMRLILTNSEARKLLSDISLVGRDLFARGAAKAADKARPDQEALARVDDAGPNQQWVAPDGTTRGAHEAPPDVVDDETYNKGKSAVNTAQQARGQYQDIKSHGRGLASDVANNASNPSDAANIAQSGFNDRAQDFQDQNDLSLDQVPQEHRDRANAAVGSGQQFQDDLANAPDEEKGDVAKSGFKDRFNALKGKVPQQHRDKANEQYQQGVQFLKDEFPEERRDQWIYRLKKVIVECQNHKDYQEALTWFIGATETYVGHGRTLASHHASKAGDVKGDPTLQRATAELRTLLERFANGQSLDGIFGAVDQLSQDAQNDEGLRNWFKELDTYIRKALLEPGFILSPQFNNDGNRLQDTGHQFFDERYRAHKDNLFDQIQSWFTAFGDDPLNRRFADDWKRLTKDLLFAEDGSLSYKPHLWTDIRKVIVPQLINHVGYVPIPRIEYTDNSMDMVIENLTMEGTNLLPNIIAVDAHNSIQFSPYDAIPDHNAHDFKFTFSQIQTDMRDVAFYINRKTGPIKYRDSGLADVFLGGSGMTAHVHLSDAGKDSSSVFKVKDVTVKIDSLKFSVRDTKHDLLIKTFKPLVTGLVKKQISKAVQDAIRTGLEYLDGQLVGVRDRYAEARQDPDVSTTDAFKSLFDRKQAEVASKAESAKQKSSQFKVVTSRRDSSLVEEGYEGGWANKVADRELAAEQGEGWKSSAFNIVPTATGHGGTGAPRAVTGAPAPRDDIKTTTSPKVDTTGRTGNTGTGSGIAGAGAGAGSRDAYSSQPSAGGVPPAINEANTGYGSRTNQTAGFDSTAAGYGNDYGKSGLGGTGTGDKVTTNAMNLNQGQGRGYESQGQGFTGGKTSDQFAQEGTGTVAPVTGTVPRSSNP